MCCGEAGEKEKDSARGTTGRGMREERLPPFSSSHRPRRAFYFFDYCYLYRDTQREPLREERVLVQFALIFQERRGKGGGLLRFRP